MTVRVGIGPNQIRVRVTVTVTTPETTTSVSSVVERVANDNSSDRIRNWLGTEAPALYTIAKAGHR